MGDKRVEKTIGQVAYESLARAVGSRAAPWSDIRNDERDMWESIALDVVSHQKRLRDLVDNTALARGGCPHNPLGCNRCYPRDY